MIFEDRVDAGQRLAGKLGTYAGRKDVLVLGISQRRRPYSL